jgi:hypothetical protein
MLTHIPERMIPFAVFGIGGAMLVVIMLIHGFGLDQIIGRYKAMAARMRKEDRHPRLAVFIFAGTILLMLMLHSVEIWIWTVLLYGGGLVENVHRAAYFSANAYTTLGMGDMVLPHNWHELSPMIAISGLFAFAWTTSEIFNIVGDQRELVMELKDRQQQKAQ